MQEPTAVSVGLFAKYPKAGQVKTRLIPQLGAEGACGFATYLLLSMIERLLGTATSNPFSLTIWTAGGSADEWQELVAVLPVETQQQIEWREQADVQLGERMAQALEYQLESSERAIVVGTDAIQFDGNSVLEMTLALDRAETVFLPALDGGYVAVGTSRVNRCLFDESIPWGTPAVLQKTLEIARHESQSVACHAPQLDLDEPEGLSLAINKGIVPEDWADRYRR